MSSARKGWVLCSRGRTAMKKILHRNKKYDGFKIAEIFCLKIFCYEVFAKQKKKLRPVYSTDIAIHEMLRKEYANSDNHDESLQNILHFYSSNSVKSVNQ